MTDALARAPSAPIEFACAVRGEKLTEPALTADAVCARFAGPLAQASGRSLETVRGAPTGQDWIKLDVRFAKPGIVAATLSRAHNGQIATHPEIAVATSDRPLDALSIDRLAHELVLAMQKIPQH